MQRTGCGKFFTICSLDKRPRCGILLGMKNKVFLRGALAEIGACLLFGASFLFTSVALRSASAATMLFWRFLLACAALSVLALTGVLKIRLRGKDLRPLLLMALCEPILYFIGETNGIARTTTSESGTLIACIPIATLLLARPVLGERPTRAQWLGISLSVLGVALVALAKGLDASFDLVGYAFLLLAVCGGGMFTVMSRRAAGFNTAEKTYVMALLGLAVFGSAALVEHAMAGTLGVLFTLPLRDPAFLWSILFLSLGCQIVAFLLTHYAIAAIGPTQTSSFIGLVTVVSILLGVLVLRERFVWLQGAGSVLVLAGVYVANMALWRPEIITIGGEAHV